MLEHADPVHKVTILPTGMALGVTQQLPLEERHIYPREVIEDSLAVRMGGRAAELLVYGDLSTGASNDLVGNTELARKMVREWGMSEELGPMAWGSQGMVFLGEDLMHTRDYSEDTARVVDAEISRILRAPGGAGHRAAEPAPGRPRSRGPCAAGTRDARRRGGGKLVDAAYGRPVHEPQTVRRFLASKNGEQPATEATPAPASATAGQTPGESDGPAAVNPTD